MGPQDDSWPNQPRRSTHFTVSSTGTTVKAGGGFETVTQESGQHRRRRQNHHQDVFELRSEGVPRRTALEGQQLIRSMDLQTTPCLSTPRPPFTDSIGAPARERPFDLHGRRRDR